MTWVCRHCDGTKVNKRNGKRCKYCKRCPECRKVQIHRAFEICIGCARTIGMPKKVDR